MPRRTGADPLWPQRFCRLIYAALLAQAFWAHAHEQLGELIQHTCQLTVSSKHIDVTMELTFFEEPSARERNLIDANKDGAISKREKQDYLASVALKVKDQVTLRVAGQLLALQPLYDPELDLPATDSSGHSHHRLRLFLFAPTPAGLKPGTEILVEDRLWSGFDSIATLKANGRDGCRLETESVFDQTRKNHNSSVQIYKIRCILPPRQAVPSK